jgi:hypothetical protein
MPDSLRNEEFLRDIFVGMLFILKSKIIKNCYTRADLLKCMHEFIPEDNNFEKYQSISLNS